MKKNLIWITVCFFLVSCSSNHQKTVSKENLIEVDLPTTPNSKSDTSLIKSIDYIPLSLTKEILISGINKILFVNGVFFILDSGLKTIFSFDRDGNFIRKIRRVGKGPGEYLGINKFDVDKEGNVCIYDNLSGKIIIYYDKAGDYKEIKMKTYFEEFALINDGLILRNNYNKGIITSHIAKSNYENDEIEELVGKEEYCDDFDIPRYGSFALFRSEQNISFHSRFTGNIYTINQKGELTHSLRINGSYPTKEFINRLKGEYSPFANFHSKYIIDIRDIYETPSHISVTIEKLSISNLLISKTTHRKVLMTKIEDENYFGNDRIYGVAEGQFISQLNSQLTLGKDWTDKVNRSTLSEKNKQILLNTTIDDNPMLILINFKDF